MRPWTFLQDTAWAAEVGEGHLPDPGSVSPSVAAKTSLPLQKNWLQGSAVCPKLGALLFRVVGKVAWVFPLDTIDLPEKLSLCLCPVRALGCCLVEGGFLLG